LTEQASQTHYEETSTGKLSVLGSVLVFLGMLALAASVIMAVLADDWAPLGISVVWLVIGVACLCQGLVAFVLLGALVDIIGLLREAARR